VQVFVQAAASGAGRPISEVFPGIEAQLPPAVGAASEARNSAAETVTGACLEAEVSWPAKARPELPRAASITNSRKMAHLFMLLLLSGSFSSTQQGFYNSFAMLSRANPGGSPAEEAYKEKCRELSAPPPDPEEP